MSDRDYDDPNEEALWLRSMRGQASDYVVLQALEYGELGEYPAWHLIPHIAIWAASSRKNPESVGWWVICGDLPTDYISATESRHPRGALRGFCDRWEELSSSMSNGVIPQRFQIGQPENGPELADLLKRRVQLLRGFAADDEVWDYDEAEFDAPSS